jgi:hypothetical protein
MKDFTGMNTLFVTIALGAAVIAAPALAQAPGGGGGYGQRDQTRAEAQQRADMLFQMLDGNKDGTVTRAEAEQALAQFQAAQGGEGGQGGGRGRMMQRMIEQAFATSPSMTQQQLEAMALSRFDAQDLNHDGTVTAAERQQLHDQRAQARGVTPAPAQPQ